MDLCQDASLKSSTTEGECNKKQIKMWFSPRRGKARYVLERGVNQQIPLKHEQIPELETYEFVSSSPTMEPTKKKKKNNSKRRKPKKKKLEDINQEWGVGTQTQNSDDGKKSYVSNNIRSVSFCNSPVVLTSPSEQENDQKCDSPIRNNRTRNETSFNEYAETESKNTENLPEVTLLEPQCSVPVSNNIVFKSLSEQGCDAKDDEVDESNQHGDKNGVDDSEDKASNKKVLRSARQKNVTSKRETKVLKRKERTSPSPVSSISKRSRKEPQKPGGSCKSEKIEISDPNPEQPKLLSKPSTPSSKNKDGRRTSQTSTSIQMSPNNLSVSKKNIRGETLLHVAAIKVIIGQRYRMTFFFFSQHFIFFLIYYYYYFLSYIIASFIQQKIFACKSVFKSTIFKLELLSIKNTCLATSLEYFKGNYSSAITLLQKRHAM